MIIIMLRSYINYDHNAPHDDDDLRTFIVIIINICIKSTVTFFESSPLNYVFIIIIIIIAIFTTSFIIPISFIDNNYYIIFSFITIFMLLGRLEQERLITPSNELPTDHLTKIDKYKAEIITLEKKLAEELQKASLAMFKNVQVCTCR